MDTAHRIDRPSHGGCPVPPKGVSRSAPRCIPATPAVPLWLHPYMKVRLSRAFWHTGPLCLHAHARVVLGGRGGPVSQQQLHHLTCGRSDGSAPECLMHEALP